MSFVNVTDSLRGLFLISTPWFVHKMETKFSNSFSLDTRAVSGASGVNKVTYRALPTKKERKKEEFLIKKTKTSVSIYSFYSFLFAAVIYSIFYIGTQ